LVTYRFLWQQQQKATVRLTQVAFVGYPTAAKKKPVTAMETQKKSLLPS
jgi:hypothetical protein